MTAGYYSFFNVINKKKCNRNSQKVTISVFAPKKHIWKQLENRSLVRTLAKKEGIGEMCEDVT